jgi:hypothetical protein
MLVGNGEADAFTHGLTILRSAFGVTGRDMIDKTVPYNSTPPLWSRTK